MRPEGEMVKQSKERCEGRGRRSHTKDKNEKLKREERGEAKEPGMKQVVPHWLGNWD